MKPPLLVFSLTCATLTAAEEPSLFEFKAKTPDLPPLSLSTPQTSQSGPLTLFGQQPPAALGRLKNRKPAATATAERKIISRMPILAPREGVDPKMPVKAPDAGVDYKLLIKKPELELAGAPAVSAPAATAP